MLYTKSNEELENGTVLNIDIENNERKRSFSENNQNIIQNTMICSSISISALLCFSILFILFASFIYIF